MHPRESSDELVFPAGEHPPVAVPVHPVPAKPKSRFRRQWRIALALFAVTCVSTFLAGMQPGAGMPNPAIFFRADIRLPPEFVSQLLHNGAIYAGALMLTLLLHEMGHYLQSRRYGVPASPPFFIPMPISPFGTMGAVIVQGAGVAHRRALFDIAVSGPLAGLVAAIPIAWWGALQAEVVTRVPGMQGMEYGDPLILKCMFALIHGHWLGPDEVVLLNPLLFAGWVGIFITGLNLIPIGQLDGGHILYTLIGKKAHVVALVLLWGGIGYMVYTGNPAFGLLAFLLLLMGPRHPPTANDAMPLGPMRHILGWLTLSFIVLGMTPTPIILHDGQPEPSPPRQVEPQGDTTEWRAPWGDKRSGAECESAGPMDRAGGGPGDESLWAVVESGETPMRGPSLQAFIESSRSMSVWPSSHHSALQAAPMNQPASTSLG